MQLNFSMFKYVVMVCGLISVYPSSVSADIRLPRLISDGMVLQRAAKVRIWGWADSGENVTVRFLGKTYQSSAASNHQWSVWLSPLKAGGPYSMEIDGNNHIVLKDILIGEVWVCAGQSNMVLPMDRVKYKYTDIIAGSANPEIRQFLVPETYDFKTPHRDLPSGKWEAANPWSVLHFSATAYFFARSLFKKYHVPIGIINASVGGTPVSAWMSKTALQPFPEYLKTAQTFSNDQYVDSIRKTDAKRISAWTHRLWTQDKGLNEGIPWYDPGYDASKWSTLQMPGYWSDQGLKNIHGAIWLRKQFNVPSGMAGKAATLWLGRIVNADYAYVNGVFVGTIPYQYPPSIFKIAAGILKPGDNIVVVRVLSHSGKGGFIKDKTYAVKSKEGTVDLKGTWQYKIGATVDSLAAQTFIQYKPLGLFNGMIAPLTHYTIKGVAWYQGEANTDAPQHYHALFSAMITDWRHQWEEGNFPFLFVQLPNYGTPQQQPTEQSGWAAIRNAQLKTLALSHTAMAITIDIGEYNDLHPLDKQDVGKRLALAAQRLAYDDDTIVYSGPIFQSMVVQNGKAIITFNHTGKGLMAKGNSALRCFAIEGANHKLLWANAKIIAPDKIMVWNEQVPDPLRVQYSWADSPDRPNLFNQEGLPAAPFRTAIR